MTTHWADIDLVSVSSLEAPVFKREQFTEFLSFCYKKLDKGDFSL